jgi:G3E family GTPase
MNTTRIRISDSSSYLQAAPLIAARSSFKPLSKNSRTSDRASKDLRRKRRESESAQHRTITSLQLSEEVPHNQQSFQQQVPSQLRMSRGQGFRTGDHKLRLMEAMHQETKPPPRLLIELVHHLLSDNSRSLEKCGRLQIRSLFRLLDGHIVRGEDKRIM